MGKGNPRNNGARRPGRPSTGITKKVSLTLTEDEWSKVDEYDTASAYIKSLEAEIKQLREEKQVIELLSE